MDTKGEVLLIILSSLAQDESRNISENSTWGIRKRFEIGQHKMSTKRFLGYDADEVGKLIVNRQQAKIVKRLFREFLWGKTTDYIKRIFERERVKNKDGGTKWQSTTLGSMLENEKASNPALTYKLTSLTDISGVVFCIQPVTLLPMAISDSASQNLYFLFCHSAWEAL